MGLAEVLMAHRRDYDDDCSCSIYCLDETYEQHLATAVLAWLETLAQNEAVELAVRRAIATRTSGHAATAAVTAFLTAAKDAS